MEVKCSNLADTLQRTVSPVREIMSFADKKTLEKMGVDPKTLISFGGGWVNHNSPEEYRLAYIEAAKDEKIFHYCGGYSPTSGESFCKTSIVNYEKKVYEIENISEKNIIIGQSSSQLTSLLFRVLLNDDDKICLLDPSYCNYPLQILTSTNSDIIRFPVIDEKTFEYIGNKEKNIENFAKFLEENKPKIVLIVAPDNPTGQLPSDSFMKSVYESVKKYGGVIVLDLAYKELIFKEKPEYFSWSPDGNFISIHSNSKWGRNLGRRLGWIEAPQYIIEGFETFQNSSILCPDRFHQFVFSKYFDENIENGNFQKYVKSTKELYKKTADIMVESIEKYVKLPYLIPEGGLYTCIKVDENSAKFVQNLLKEKGVLVIPGWGFGNTLSESVRLSFGPLVYNHERLIEGLKRMGQFLEK